MRKGQRHTEEAKLKNRLAHLGKKDTEETRKKRSLSHIGNKNGLGNKTWLGKHLSEEHKKKISLARLGQKNYEVNGMFGKHHSEETKRKMSLARIGNKNAVGNKIWVGRHHTPESKIKIKTACALTRVYNQKDTKIELMLQEALRKRGINFVKNYNIVGRPDIALPEYKIAIFADGDYYHANPLKYDKDKIIFGKKASEIREYDNSIIEQLNEKGWMVFRYWETEINASTDVIVAEIQEEMRYINPNQ